MDLMYSSTRNAGEKVTASQAVLQGLANDGGLFVPNQLPKLDLAIRDMITMDYKAIAYELSLIHI